jgi:hypothetical protein
MSKQSTVINVAGRIEPTLNDTFDAHAVIYLQPGAGFYTDCFKPNVFGSRQPPGRHERLVGDQGFSITEGNAYFTSL